MGRVISPDSPDPDDMLCWDRDRDGRMADYADVALTVAVEDYDPAKDPVHKGLTDPDGRVS